MAGRFGWPARAALLLLALLAASAWLKADTALPPKPDKYFVDEAGVVDATAWGKINEELAQNERATSNQIVVAVYPSLPDGADLAQYCTQIYNAWGVGQAGASHGKSQGDNGAVLFVFVNSHKMFIATGRGLEGALPDITCKDIIENVIRPHFQEQDFTSGIEAGIGAMIAATKGEYKGTGRTNLENERALAAKRAQEIETGVFIAVFVILFLLRGVVPGIFGAPWVYSSGGYGRGYGGWGGGGFYGGFGSGGGGGGGGGFSGFSGGGGTSAGGGAGGSW